MDNYNQSAEWQEGDMTLFVKPCLAGLNSYGEWQYWEIKKKIFYGPICPKVGTHWTTHCKVRKKLQEQKVLIRQIKTQIRNDYVNINSNIEKITLKKKRISSQNLHTSSNPPGTLWSKLLSK